MSSLTVIKSVNDFEHAISLPGVTVIDFYSLRCPICVAMNRIYDRIAVLSEFRTIRFCKLDSDENADTKELSSGLPEIPHFRVFYEGNVFARFTGYQSWGQLKDWLITCIGEIKQLSTSTLQSSHDAGGGDNHIFSISDTSSTCSSNSLGIDKIFVTSTLKELSTLTTSHKHLVIGFYQASNRYAGAMIHAFRTVATMANFSKLAFALHDSDSKKDSHNNEMFSERFWLSLQPWMLVLRHGEEIGNLKGVINVDNLKDWLMEYLDANEIADSVGARYLVDWDRKKSDPHAGALPCSNLYLPVAPPFREVSDMEDLHKLTSRDRVVVVIFHDERSMRSHAMQSVLNRVVSLGNFKRCEFCIIHFVEQEGLARALGVVKCPSLSIFCNGAIHRTDEAMGWAELENWLTQSTRESTNENMGACESICNTDIHDISPNELPITWISSLSPVRCKGSHKDRAKTPWYRKRKPFMDPEPSCVVFPMVEEGLQIGRATEGASYFNIMLWHMPSQDPGHMSFGIGLGPDPTKNARFESALFSVTFGYSGIDKFLNILDLQPKYRREVATLATWRRSSGTSFGMSGASFRGRGFLSRNAEFTREIASRVTGNGVRSSTATWTFKEDEGSVGRHGLGTQYDLSVCLPTASLHIWMKFWAKAVLIDRNGRRAVLKIGTNEKPYMRYLDLNNSICTQ